MDFPQQRATVIGDVVFDTRDRSSSLTVTMTWMLVAAGFGIAGALRSRRLSATQVWYVVLIPCGLGMGWLVSLTIAYVANRYLGDAVPWLAFVGVVGLETMTPLHRVTKYVVIALVMANLWVNMAMGLTYQRLYAAPTDTQRARFLTTQLHVRVGGDPALQQIASENDPVAPTGTFGVLGACPNLFWSDGERWVALGSQSDTTVATLCTSLTDG